MTNVPRRPGDRAANHNPKRVQGADAPRRQILATPASQEILARFQPGHANPLRVLEAVIGMFNTQHTALDKVVSHKTRVERAQFLRRFFLDLKNKAGFSTIPDPRNLGQKHLHAMVQVWQRERLAAATIQTYLSFLRGLALWLGKPGFVRKPAFYGLQPDEYERHENAQRDQSWSANGLDVEKIIAQVEAFDARVASSMRLMAAFALRRKESVMLRPYEHVIPFEKTGLPEEARRADEYLWIKGKGGRVRWEPIQTPEQITAVEKARMLVTSRDAHMGNPAKDLKQNLLRLDYVLRKFGITRKLAGTTAHGLRHGNLIALYEQSAGALPPVRGGSGVSPDVDRAARRAVAQRAGHSRLRAAGAYIGARTLSIPESPAPSPSIPPDGTKPSGE
ncbi:phage integrase N-terminal domain-containing protein [Pseudorhodoferax sp.]|uniref:phage integrase N-terminal domain-containing protein n=1 Tax=Pseudorhodoferax sp. TaxID=1993553 RepID=UPI002DD6A794|nr:phage integrase N-terminal domain-containing protein [Pseudorhodoferax sp.]